MPTTLRKFACSGFRVIGFFPSEMEGFVRCEIEGVNVRQLLEYRCEIEAESDEKAIPLFLEKTGVPAHHIGFREVAGRCEACMRGLFIDDEYLTDEDGVRICERCQE